MSRIDAPPKTGTPKPPLGARLRSWKWWLYGDMNSQPPELSSLEVVRGTVVHTSRQSPHLGLKLPTGESLNMEFPVFLNTYGADARTFRHLPGKHNGDFLGCEATVWFDMPRYTLWKRYRVWQIVYDNAQAGATYSELVAESSIDLTLRGVFAFFLIPLGMGIWFIRYRRGYYER